MNKEQLAERYVIRIKRCFIALKIFIGFSVAAVAALVIFAVVAVNSGMNENDPAALMLGLIIIMIAAVLSVAGALSSLLAAKITVTKLKNSGGAEDKVE